VTPPSHHEKLAQFGDLQLAELSTRDVCASTVHLILATAFFTGAAIGLATPLKANKKTYLASLCDFLENHFGLSAENAAGMVESNARLYKRYVLIEKIYNAGAQAALGWHKDSTIQDPTLKNLLMQYQTLNMSGLNIEGVKEPKPTPVEIETIAHIEPVPEVVTRSPRWGRWLFWGLLIVLFGLVGFGLLFPEQIPSPLLEILPESIRTLLHSTITITP